MFRAECRTVLKTLLYVCLFQSVEVPGKKWSTDFVIDALGRSQNPQYNFFPDRKKIKITFVYQRASDSIKNRITDSITDRVAAINSLFSIVAQSINYCSSVPVFVPAKQRSCIGHHYRSYQWVGTIVLRNVGRRLGGHWSILRTLLISTTPISFIVSQILLIRPSSISSAISRILLIRTSSISTGVSRIVLIRTPSISAVVSGRPLIRNPRRRSSVTLLFLSIGALAGRSLFIFSVLPICTLDDCSLLICSVLPIRPPRGPTCVIEPGLTIRWRWVFISQRLSRSRRAHWTRKIPCRSRRGSVVVPVLVVNPVGSVRHGEGRGSGRPMVVFEKTRIHRRRWIFLRQIARGWRSWLVIPAFIGVPGEGAGERRGDRWASLGISDLGRLCSLWRRNGVVVPVLVIAPHGCCVLNDRSVRRTEFGNLTLRFAELRTRRGELGGATDRLTRLRTWRVVPRSSHALRLTRLRIWRVVPGSSTLRLTSLRIRWGERVDAARSRGRWHGLVATRRFVIVPALVGVPPRSSCRDYGNCKGNRISLRIIFWRKLLLRILRWYCSLRRRSVIVVPVLVRIPAGTRARCCWGAENSRILWFDLANRFSKIRSGWRIFKWRTR